MYIAYLPIFVDYFKKLVSIRVMCFSFQFSHLINDFPFLTSLRFRYFYTCLFAKVNKNVYICDLRAVIRAGGQFLTFDFCVILIISTFERFDIFFNVSRYKETLEFVNYSFFESK